MSDKDEIELVQGEDGVYSERGKPHRPAKVPAKKEQKKPKKSENVEAFLGGVDTGLDLLEGIGERLDRYLKWKP